MPNQVSAIDAALSKSFSESATSISCSANRWSRMLVIVCRRIASGNLTSSLASP